MSSELTPYNITLTDQSAYILYYPHRSGLEDEQWQVSYTQSDPSDWSYNDNFGMGTSSHVTTHVGASAVLNWVGTAVWLLGDATKESYSITMDSGEPLPGAGSEDGVLYSNASLTYGLHSVNLTVLAGQLTFSGATITVGMGEYGTVLQNRTIQAINDDMFPLTGNPFFIADSSWATEALYANQTEYPCIVTNTRGATLSFDINEAVGFEIYGSDDWTQGLFTVSVTGGSGDSQLLLPNSSVQYSPRSNWTAINQLKYLATGLNRSETYSVEITNLYETFNLASVVAYDAVPSPTTASSLVISTTSTSMPSISMPGELSSRHTLATGAIIGVVLGILIVIICMITIVVVARRRILRKRRYRESEQLGLAVPHAYPATYTPAPTHRKQRQIPWYARTLTGSDGITAYGSSEPPTMDEKHAVGIHEVDAGPIVLPPMYNQVVNAALH